MVDRGSDTGRPAAGDWSLPLFRVAHENGIEQLGADLGLRVKAHDSHRVQWIATVPLADPGQSRKCEIRFDLAIPERIWRPHDPWQRLFVRTRLGSPRLWTGADDLLQTPNSVAKVHRQALSAVHELKNAGAEVRGRLAKLAAADGEMDGAMCMALCERVEAAIARTASIRDRLDTAAEQYGGSDGMADEVRLALEYISSESLRLVMRAREGLSGTWPPRARAKPVHGHRKALEDLIRQAAKDENAWRKARKYVVAAANDRATVDLFVHRAGLLKRHFQQALFLDAQVKQTDERLGNWVAGFVAVVASTWYFIWQVYYLNEAMQMGTTLVSLIMAGGVAGLLYAVKDRIKELGRRYVSRLLKDMYADREVRLRLRSDSPRSGRLLAIAQETVRRTTLHAPDETDGDLSGIQNYRVLHVRDVVSHKGGLDVQNRGITSIKHILRYDLSALFSSVDDLAKSVVVADGDNLRTVQTRRAYRVPLRARLYIDGAQMPIVERFGELVIRGRKLRGYRSAPKHANVWTALPD